MTPIEVVAAKIERCLDLLDIDIDTEESLKIARAALLALAEVELPEEVMNDSLTASRGADRYCYERGQFSAILRSLAGDWFKLPPSQPQN